MDQLAVMIDGRAKQGAAPSVVTLIQIAAIVNRSKRTLEGLTKDMPLPAIEGGGGRPAEWDWEEVPRGTTPFFGISPQKRPFVTH